MSEGYWESSKVNNFIKLQGYTLKKVNLIYYIFHLVVQKLGNK